MSIFQTESKFPGARGLIRRSLTKLETGAIWFRKMVQAAEALKVPFEAPYWRADCYAHLGFPSKKAVVVIGHQMSWIEDRGFRPLWKAHGFRTLGIISANVTSMPFDELVMHLKVALNSKETTE